MSGTREASHLVPQSELAELKESAKALTDITEAMKLVSSLSTEATEDGFEDADIEAMFAALCTIKGVALVFTEFRKEKLL
jgi:hypothetical protein